MGGMGEENLPGRSSFNPARYFIWILGSSPRTSKITAWIEQDSNPKDKVC